MVSTRDVATVFITDDYAKTLADRLSDMAETLIDHHTTMIDIRHCTDIGQKPKRVKVMVSLEDA